MVSRSRVSGDDIVDLLTRSMNVEVPSDDVDLIASGLIDSLALVDFILQVESEYGIEIALDDLDLEVFRSVSAIAEFVSELQQVAQTA